MKKQTRHRVQEGAVWAAAILLLFGSAGALLFVLVPMMIDIGTRAAYGVAAYFVCVGISMALIGMWVIGKALEGEE